MEKEEINNIISEECKSENNITKISNYNYMIKQITFDVKNIVFTRRKKGEKRFQKVLLCNILYNVEKLI